MLHSAWTWTNVDVRLFDISISNKILSAQIFTEIPKNCARKFFSAQCPEKLEGTLLETLIEPCDLVHYLGLELVLHGQKARPPLSL